MDTDHPTRKRFVRVSLRDDLVTQVEQLTPNLSETVETLLTDYVAREHGRRAALDRQIADHISASEAFVAAHGSLADEFPAL